MTANDGIPSVSRVFYRKGLKAMRNRNTLSQPANQTAKA